jgi:hypothetical protein
VGGGFCRRAGRGVAAARVKPAASLAWPNAETTGLKGLALLALCFACLGVSTGKRAVVLRRARERKRVEVQRSNGKWAVMVTGRGSGFQTWLIFQQLIR